MTMAMNLDAIPNYLAEKEKKTQGVTQNQGQVSPEGTEGAPSAMPGATQSDTPNTSVQATPVTPLSSSTVKENVAKGIHHIPKTVIPEVATIEKPVLEPVDVDKMKQSQRNNYVQSFATWADAEKAGDISQQEWAYGQIQKMVAEGKNPGEYLNMLSMLGSAETPTEKEKRERREALGETFRGLGNLIGNAANLYNATRGGTPVDLNTANEKHRARMEQIKAKQDALDERLRETLVKAKMGDMAAERAEKAAEKKSESDAKAANLQFQRDVYLKEIDNAFKLGQIDAQTKAKLAEEVLKAKNEKELEAYKQSNRIILKTTPGAKSSEAVTSFTMPNGDIYTLDRELDDLEIMELAKYMKDPSPYMTVGENGQVTHRDYKRAALDAVKSGAVPTEVLERIGYKKIGGFGYGEKNKEEEGSKTPPSKRSNDKKVPPSKRNK